MGGYQVTPEDVAAASAYVTGRAEDLNTKILALGQYVQGLSEFWAGPTHNAFETLMGDYNTYATMLNNALTDIASGLQGNYVNYTQTEQTNLSNIVKVSLPKATFS